MRLPFDTNLKHFTRLKFLLDCGREVSLEGCCIIPSTLGFLEGSKDIVRSEVLKHLPRTVKYFFRGINTGIFIKLVPEGELPLFTFMVELVSMSGVSDGEISTLVVCWLGDDIDTNLPELIDREVRSVDWDKYAGDFKAGAVQGFNVDTCHIQVVCPVAREAIISFCWERVALHQECNPILSPDLVR